MITTRMLLGLFTLLSLFSDKASKVSMPLDEHILHTLEYDQEKSFKQIRQDIESTLHQAISSQELRSALTKLCEEGNVNCFEKYKSVTDGVIETDRFVYCKYSSKVIGKKGGGQSLKKSVAA